MQQLQHGGGNVVQDDLATASAKPVYLNDGIGFEEDDEEADSSSGSTSSEEEIKENKVRQPEIVDFEPADCTERPVDQAIAYRELPYQRFVMPNSGGARQPVYEHLDAMSMEEGAHRLIHVDFVYPTERNLKGGCKQLLICRDYKTDFVTVKPLASKDDTANALGEIGIANAWHKRTHVVHVVSDGEPILRQQVREACLRLGLSHGTSVPGRPNTNPAGSNVVRNLRGMANCALLDASQHGGVIDGRYSAHAWLYAAHTHNRLANNNDLHRRTPYELNCGLQPKFNQAPFGAPGYMHMSDEARRAHVARGGRSGSSRGDPGLYMGEDNGHHLVLTERGTFRKGPFFFDPHGRLGIFPGTEADLTTGVQQPSTTVDELPQSVQTATARERVRSATGVLLTSADGKLRVHLGKKLSSTAYIRHRCEGVAGLTVAEALQKMFQNAAGVLVRYRRTDMDYDLKRKHLRLELIDQGSSGDLQVEEAACMWNTAMMVLSDEVPAHVHQEGEVAQSVYLTELLDTQAQKNLSWKTFLAPGHPNRQDAIQAYNAEIESIIAMGVMVELQPGTAKYATALTSPNTTPTRVLLDVKRKGEFKARIVVRGDKENKEAVDGKGYNYYAPTAHMTEMRMVLLQPGRHVLKPGQTTADYIVASSRDIRMAFCQTRRFDDGIQRFLQVKSPIDGVHRYYDQLSSLYGSCSAPKRWQETFDEWVITSAADGGPGFVRGSNAPAVYHLSAHSDRGALLLIIYVDDIWLTGKKADQLWFWALLDKRFECKPVQWLEKGKSVDHLGITVHQDDDYVWLSMENYINNMLKILNLTGCAPMATPITGPIVDLKELSDERKKYFRTALGMVGYLSTVTRLDIRYAFSIAAQHAATPCQGALDLVVRIIRYLASTSKLAIRQSLHEAGEWKFYSDSDFGGNPTPVNERRSQLGYVAMWGTAPIAYSSKSSTVQLEGAGYAAGFQTEMPPPTAHPAIKDLHVSRSSAESELYAATVCADGVLALGYTAEECGFPFPKPAVILVDNMAAICFSRQSQFAGRSKMKHIDCRQHWIQVLRDSKLIECVHVSTEYNLADLYTKPLDMPRFVKLRDAMMAWCPH